jgi:hypothetical protein
MSELIYNYKCSIIQKNAIFSIFCPEIIDFSRFVVDLDMLCISIGHNFTLHFQLRRQLVSVSSTSLLCYLIIKIGSSNRKQFALYFFREFLIYFSLLSIFSRFCNIKEAKLLQHRQPMKLAICITPLQPTIHIDL